MLCWYSALMYWSFACSTCPDSACEARKVVAPACLEPVRRLAQRLGRQVDIALRRLHQLGRALYVQDRVAHIRAHLLRRVAVLGLYLLVLGIGHLFIAARLRNLATPGQRQRPLAVYVSCECADAVPIFAKVALEAHT